MSTEEKKTDIIKLLLEHYPDAGIHLDYETPLQLLIATILAAQCTDKKVNEITPSLWKAYPTADSIAHASSQELQKIIRPTGFYRQKTDSIQKACRVIVQKHGGRVPRTLSDLTELPGVGRKTANVVLANIFKSQTIPVDTHVKRVSLRLGLASEDDPDKIEKQLCELIPERLRTKSALALGEHGRRVCKSRRPSCDICFVSHLCAFLSGADKSGEKNS